MDPKLRHIPVCLNTWIPLGLMDWSINLKTWQADFIGHSIKISFRQKIIINICNLLLNLILPRDNVISKISIRDDEAFSKSPVVHTQQKSYSISHLQDTCWLDNDSVVTVLNSQQNGDWAENASVVTVLPAVINSDYTGTVQSLQSYCA